MVRNARLVIGGSWLLILILSVALGVGYMMDQQTIQHLTHDRDKLATEKDTLSGKVSDLEKSSAEKDKLITQIQEDRTLQSTRADTAEALGGQLAEVIQLDDQIHQRYMGFLYAVDAMNDATKSYDLVNYNSAYSLAMQTAAELDSLFQQRTAIMAELQAGQGGHVNQTSLLIP